MIIGIDAGSTNSCAAIWDGKLRMIEMTEGGATSMPSVVTIANGVALVGQAAVDAGRVNPDYDYRNWKILTAKRWSDDKDQGFQTCAGPDGMIAFRGPDGSLYSPTELTSFVIGEIVHAANEYLEGHDTVTGAVIGVPATFTPDQIEAVKEAARMAGLKNVTTLEEPVAAAIANNIDAKKTRTSVVYDHGGGTVDITVIRSGEGLIKVLAKNGIGEGVGGADYDRRLADFVVNLFRTEHKKDLALRDAAMTRILIEAEQVKKRLTDVEETVFRVENVDRTAEGVSLHMIYPISRRTMEQLTVDLQKNIIDACRAAMEDAKKKDPKWSQADIHELIFAGGMTRSPIVRQTVSEFFGKQPKRDESPEQVVAQGLAIKAAIIEGRKPDVTVADILSFDVAIETRANVPAIVLSRGTSFPVEKTLKLRNADDDQTELSVRLMFANRPRASDCHILEARDIPIDPGPAETREVVLTIQVDSEGHPSIAEIAA
jgi:molecular chaperone DnaK